MSEIKGNEMAIYPYREFKLMDNYELARAYSWDMRSTLKLVKIEMHMTLNELNSNILEVIEEHSSDIEDYEKFYHDMFDKHRKEDVTNVTEVPEVKEKELSDIEEEDDGGGPEVLDEMKDKDVDYLDLIMPNLSLPKIEPDGGNKKVQFTLKKPVSACTFQIVYHKGNKVIVLDLC